MKRRPAIIIGSVAIACLLALSAFSIRNQRTDNQDNSSKYTAIHEVLKTQLAAWNKGSIDGFMQGYHNSDSILFMTRNGAQYGWENLRKMYHKSFPNREKMGNLTFEIEDFHQIEPNLQLVIGKWLVDQSTDKKSGYFTLLFRLIDGRWQIVMDHTFSDPKVQVKHVAEEEVEEEVEDEMDED